ncbi:Soraphen polyketide synthase A, related [Neospora caninum Liverpool]|uniref:Soraphen polyketide synthase A, related n=1 Tax=Neospora caninum (strain Liverpool) TaxID=572307 RepID=F0VEY8_NEOCL|nr:Soraphen polyketide synthase A, related [Neospora caninum Liverpool]CBZ52282.1 Soraphen polyketide synthase A, related [Neospora caninum Liverpool]|eukprot:XP_003882314.1 Soraphen polyketide synthase A, related [Neospora caninum Liverpool]
MEADLTQTLVSCLECVTQSDGEDAAHPSTDAEYLFSVVRADDVAFTEFLTRVSAQLDVPIGPLAARAHESFSAFIVHVREIAKEQTVCVKPFTNYITHVTNCSFTEDEGTSISVVGVACRLPGNANNPLDFWSVLAEGQDAIVPIPSKRWNLKEFSEGYSERGTIYVKEGGFIDGIDEFDNGFFKISSSEARRMDPQQRMLLELSHEAFESAGLHAQTDSNHQFGVFVGCSSTECLMLVPEATVALCAAGMLALDSRCRPFDAAANGYGRGEGAVVFLLERRRYPPDGRPRLKSLATIRGHGTNHNGHNVSVTAPSDVAQKKLVDGVLRAAKVEPRQVAYLEAHGTGTKLGDTIEFRAIKSVFSSSRSMDNPLLIGSGKSNVGHLEGCAGAVGLLKALLVLYFREVPPTLHFKKVSPLIDDEGFNYRIPTKRVTLESDRPIFASVSSFGLGGCNAHVIIESVPKEREMDARSLSQRHDWNHARFPVFESSDDGNSFGGLALRHDVDLGNNTSTHPRRRSTASLFDKGTFTPVSAGLRRFTAFSSGYGTPLLRAHQYGTTAETREASETPAITETQPARRALDGDGGVYVENESVTDNLERSFSSENDNASVPSTARSELSEHDHVSSYVGVGVDEEFLQSVVLQTLRQVLKEAAPIRSDVSLKTLGIDSLAAVEFRDSLQESLGINLPASLVFDFPTIDDVCGFLTQKLNSGRGGNRRNTPGMLLQQNQNTASESCVAVRGMSCRFPGAEGGKIESFWEMLLSYSDCIQEIPTSRFDTSTIFDKDYDARDKIYVNSAGILRTADMFDNMFFKISEAEVRHIDPRQRILLEVAYDALVDSQVLGCKGLAALGNETVGVVVGCSGNDWNTFLQHHDLSASSFSGPGTSPALLSNRVSYSLALRGPSLTIDTACSSSLVAMDIARQLLNASQCNLALVGGVQLLLTADTFTHYCRARMLSPDCRCKTFDASANGYVRSEGCGVVVLENMHDRQVSKDTTYAWLLGTANNHVGRSASLTAPNGPAQQAVILAALRSAQLPLDSQICMIETHGTGTALGDPIEIGALQAVYGQGTSADTPLVLGALKSRIGHTEGAAGIAGFIKLICSLRHRIAPPNLHLKQFNPHIDISTADSSRPFLLPTKPYPLDTLMVGQKNDPLLGAVSSFGFGGSNAHAIVEVPPIQGPAGPEIAEAGLRRAQAAADEPHQPMVWLFTGQGSQYVNMAKSIYEAEDSFRETVEECSAYLAAENLMPEGGPSSLEEIIYPRQDEDAEEAERLLMQTQYSQVAIFVVELALTRVLKERGLRPAAVLGHSLGEYAAAVTAGVFSWRDALRVVAARARIMSEQEPQDGVMAACRLSAAEVQAALDSELKGLTSVAVAADNGPRSVVVSGRRAEVEQVLSFFSMSGKARFLKVSHAFHSPLMAGAVEPVRRLFEGVEFSEPAIPFSSTVLGRLTVGGELGNALYWAEQITKPVRFRESLSIVASVFRSPAVQFVEVGPCAVLVNLGKKWCMPSGCEQHRWCLAVDQCRPLAGQSSVSWQSVGAAETGSKTARHTWNHRRFPWNPTPHPLLGFREATKQEHVDEHLYQKAVPPALAEVFGDDGSLRISTLPAAAILDALIAAAKLVSQSGALGDDASNVSVQLKNYRTYRDMILPLPQDSDNADVCLTLCFRITNEHSQQVIAGFGHYAPIPALIGSPEENWLPITEATVMPDSKARSDQCLPLHVLQQRFSKAEEMAQPEENNARHTAEDWEFQSRYKSIRTVHRRDNEALVHLSRTRTVAEEGFTVCPVILTEMLFVAGTIAKGQAPFERDLEYAVSGAEIVTSFGISEDASDSFWGHVHVLPVKPGDARSRFANVTLYTEKGQASMQLQSVQLHPTGRVSVQREIDMQKSFLRACYQRIDAVLDPVNQARPTCVSSRQSLTPQTSYPHDKLIALVTEACRRVIGTDDEPDFHTPLQELGLDSLGAVAFRDALEDTFRLKLPATILFDHPDLDTLSQFIARKLEDSVEEAGVSGISVPNHCDYRDGDVAVIGMACRLPGSSNSVSEFWEALRTSVDCVAEIPPTRFDIEEFFDSDQSAKGKMYVREGGFVDGATLFDNRFFGIPAAEAHEMDPRQRLSMEVAAEAFWDAGIGQTDSASRDTLVAVGKTNTDAVRMGYGQLSPFSCSGANNSILSNRISYFFGLKGPSMTIDAACASSLIAIVAGFNELTRGACKTALVMGVNLLLSPECYIEICKATMLSPDCRCKTFDAKANGYVRSEGCCGILLKKMPRDATTSETHDVYAWLRSATTNHVGRSASLTAPNGPAQTTLIQDAIRSARLQRVSDIAVLETHGTGTSLGDPIEIGALQAVYGQGTSADTPLVLGALKSRIGHTEGAAGIAGFIKLICSLRHRIAPPNLHLKQFNPHIDISTADSSRPFLLPTKPYPLDTLMVGQKNDPLLGAVSSFGFGGSNAHAIVEVPPIQGPAGPEIAEAGLRRAQAAADEPHQPMVWLFTGQGSQYVNMAKSIYEAEDSFRETVEECSAYLAAENLMPEGGPSSLEEIIYPRQDEDAEEAERLLMQTQYSQVAIFVVELALTRVLKERGLRPAAVLGHSLGEYAAAVIAGVFSWRDALRVVAARARIMSEQEPQDGVMAACRLSAAEVQAALDSELKGLTSVAVAADNGPRSVVVSGRRAEVEQVLSFFSMSGKARFLKVSHAFHSPLMAGAVEPVRRLFEGVEFSEPAIPFSSTVLGRRTVGGELGNALYWAEQITKPVRFREATQAVTSGDLSHIRAYVEVGPSRVLSAMGRDCVSLEGAKAQEWICIVDPRSAANPVEVVAALKGRFVEHRPKDESARHVWNHRSVTLRRRDERGSKQTTGPEARQGGTFASMAPDELKAFVQATVSGAAKQVLGSADEPPTDAPLQDMGIDSLGAVEFRNNLQDSLGVKLPATILFDHPTIEALATFLGSLLHSEEGRETRSVNSAKMLSPLLDEKDSVSIAVVGMACRLPGSVNDLESFGEMLLTFKDCIQEIPPSRFSIDEVYDPDPDAKGKIYVREGGFIDGAELFDNRFFGISDAEAREMDPRQRISLEVSYEAFVDAGYSREELLGSPVGVFVGAMNHDKLYDDLRQLTSYSGTSTALAILSNRLSYTFGLTGPSVTIDTACSSSLVAAEYAALGIAGGKFDRAVVHGINVIPKVEGYILCCRARMLSASGRCRTFDATADGYARAEASACIVIEHEEKTSGRTHARLLAVATNHVGRSASITSPNGPAQQAVIRAALRSANVKSPRSVAVVETHGTGTSLGDPIEIGALQAVYGQGTSADTPLVLGALKSRIGHTEGAAGIAGFIKLICSLRHRIAPPNLHLKQFNPHIDISTADSSRPFLLPTKPYPLDTLMVGQKNDPLLGAVSSFGFGGSNAHAIVEVPPIQGPAGPEIAEAGLRRAQAAADEPHQPMVWLFTGQGSQYVNMAKALYEAEDSFRETVEECSAYLAAENLMPEGGPSSLEEIIYPRQDEDAEEAERLLMQTQYSQVAIFVVELALTRVLKERGLRPAAVLGHSLGEYAAAVTAGVFSWRDALRVVAARARIMSEQEPQDGVMAACRLSAAEVQAALDSELKGLTSVAVAADNGPRSVVVSGRRAEVEQVLSFFSMSGKARFLKVSHAFHSPLMAGAVEPVRRLFEGVEFSEPAIPFSSTVLGRLTVGGELGNALYWAEQITKPVRFREATQAVTSGDLSHIRAYVEVGPSRVLSAMGRDCVSLEGAKAQEWICIVDPRSAANPVEVVAALKGRFVEHRPKDESARHVWNHRSVTLRRRDERGSKQTTGPEARQGGTFASMAPDELKAFVQATVSGAAKQVLGSADELPTDAPLQSLGIDSLGAVEFRNAVQDVFNIRLSATLLFDYPSIQAVSDHLLNVIGANSGIDNSPSPVGHLSSTAILQEGGFNIAVVGIACRLPGSVSDLAAFGEMLLTFKDCIQEIPPSRFSIDEVYDPDPDAKGKIYVREGGFIDGAELFDNRFFGISDAEAQEMDPRQRISLEVSYEAFVDAGYSREELLGSPVGVFVGAMNHDKLHNSMLYANSLTATGAAVSILANRLSYTYGLTSSSLTVDTACSSSLVATDIANKDLVLGVCERALVVGTNVISTPQHFLDTSRSRMLSRDCRCKTFDASANGYVRAEGCCALILQRVSGLPHPRPIYAFLAGTASNHVGRSASLTAPNGPAQQAVVRAALRSANVKSPRSVAVVETHGTGTSLGDPIEIGALQAVYGQGTSADTPLVLGALKSRIGHTEGAAGIAGFIKLICSLRHRIAPPNLHLKQFNPHIDISTADSSRPFLLPTKPYPLDTLMVGQKNDPLLGAVSSFGFGGSNAHAIVEVPPIQGPAGPEIAEAGLRRAQAAADEPHQPMVWLFTGQGSQYVNMAKALYEAEDSFRETVEECSAYLAAENLMPEGGPSSLEEIIYPRQDEDAEEAERLLMQTQYSQVAIFVVELALTRVLKERGLRPAAVLGHSLGEYAAAVTAGVFSWRDALRVVAARARIMSEQEPQDGVMAACRLSAAEVQAALDSELKGLTSVAVAADNGPRSVVVSGRRAEVEQVLSFFSMSGKARFLKVSHAFHSPLMAGAVEPVRRLFEGVEFSEPAIPFSSTVLGRRTVGGELGNALYWAEQITKPVRFREATQAVTSGDLSHIRAYVEVGPSRVLSAMGRDCVSLEGAKAQEWICIVDPRSAANPVEVVAALKGRFVEHRPKDESARHVWNHKLQMNEDVKVFLMFSSTASLVGNPGQANYAAANSSLDALISHRRSRGLAGHSIQWGPWIEQGMAAGLGDRLERAGFRGISNRVGVEVVGAVVSQGNTGDAVVACQQFIWPRFAMRYRGCVPAIFEEQTRSVTLRRRDERGSKQTTGPEARQGGTFASMAPDELKAFVQATVSGAAKQVLGSADEPPTDAPLQDMGIDSLGAVEFRNNLQDSLGVKLPATILFDHPTIEALATFLGSLLHSEEGRETRSVNGAKMLSPLLDEKDSVSIAVVGMACRLPGSVNDLESFGEMLLTFKDCIQEIPPSRFSIDEVYDPDPDAKGKIYVREGGFIDGAELFDNRFFGISDAEAREMDPRQRISLEVSYEAFVDAGYSREELLGSPVGVFVGAMNHDKLYDDLRQLTSYSGTSTALAILSNRLSYTFGLTGPSIMIDCACSSSLVAMDYANMELRQDRAGLCLVVGVNIMPTADPYVHCCKARMLSPDCRCKVFAANANGYVRSEGCAALILERTAAHTPRNIKPYANLLGTANNHVGRSASITSPNGPAQQAVVRAALRSANVKSPRSVAVVETHGTGTSLGDPIEIGALQAVYGQGTSADTPLVLGALKSRIGHTEGAAGIAGFIKLICSLRHRIAPPNLHLKQFNPHIDISTADSSRPFLLPTKPYPLDTLMVGQKNDPLLGAVSSFGFGGSNAHAIVEVPPIQGPAGPEIAEAGLRRAQAAADEPHQPMVWLFTGQGSQYVNMAKALYEAEDSFRETVEECSAYLAAENLMPEGGPSSLEEIIYPRQDEDAEEAERLLMQTQYSQVAIFVVELALTRVLKERGLRPAAVLGHSLGEYAAAVTAGVFSWRDALRVVAARARIMSEQEPQDGVMAACRLSAAEVQAALNSELKGLTSVAVAADNGPRSVVVSGRRAEVEQVLSFFSMSGKARFLKVSHAFHSPLMAGAVEPVRRLFEGVEFSEPAIPFSSTVLGRLTVGGELGNALYWAEQITKPVRFREAVIATFDGGVVGLAAVEVGPKRTLANIGPACVSISTHPDYVWLSAIDGPSASESASQFQAFLKGVASLAKRIVHWNQRPFPLARLQEGKNADERSRSLTKAGPPSLPSIWSEKWSYHSDVPQIDGLNANPKKAWIIVGVPSQHMAGVLQSVKRMGLDTSRVCGLGAISSLETLRNLVQGGSWAGILVVSGLWTTTSAVECLTETAHILLQYADLSREMEVPPLAVVTRGAQRVVQSPETLSQKAIASFDSEPPEEQWTAQVHDDVPLHAGLLAFCRTARLEMERCCRQLKPLLYFDTDGVHPGQSKEALDLQLEAVFQWLSKEDVQAPSSEQNRTESATLNEWDVVVRGQSYFVPRANSVLLKQPRIPAVDSIQSSKSYIVTGGLGGIGVVVASWLMRQGAGKIFLWSRKGIPTDDVKQTSQWCELKHAMESGQIQTVRCDVSVIEQVRDSIGLAVADLTLGGIFHCAGTEGKGRLQDLSQHDIAGVYASKVEGAWNLHRICKEMSIDKHLDFFVLFSSIAALPGNDAFAAYAAANGCLDNLAEHRRSLSLPGKSIRWGPWLDVGMAARTSSFERVMKSRGIRGFHNEEAISLLEVLLGAEEDLTCCAAVHVDWRIYAHIFGSHVPAWLQDVIPGLRKNLTVTSETSTTGQRHDSMDLQGVESAVLDVARKMCGGEDPVSTSTEISSLGLDSLGAVEFRNALQESLNIKLPASLLVEYPCLKDIIQFIMENCFSDAAKSATELVPLLTRDPAAVDQGFAVVGMGCRIPKNAMTPEGFWEMLLDEVDAVCEIPMERFNIDAFYDPDPEQDKCYTRDAALLDHPDLFDNSFFNLSDQEVLAIDPQQRVLLEVAYEAFFEAGFTKEALLGNDFGVFCAAYNNDFQFTNLTQGKATMCVFDKQEGRGRIPSLGEAAGYPEPGGFMCFIPNRISYSFGLTGPSIGIDAACASALVAFDAAITKLKTGACSGALVGGVNIILSPTFFLGGCKAHQFSRAGRCKTFDCSADGLVRGEGCGAAFLLPVAAARERGIFVHAVVRGSATCHYGRSSQITSPNTRALARVLRLSLQDANTEPCLVRYYEAHGTATVLGDVIEMSAVRDVFQNDRNPATPLHMGTVHNNIGHLDAAAGIVAFIKTVLCLKHRFVPANIHFKSLHPDIHGIDPQLIKYTKESQRIMTADHVAGAKQTIFGANLAYGMGGSVAALITESGDEATGRYSPTAVPRPVWNHRQFPLNTQKFVYLMGAMGQISMDDMPTPQSDVIHVMKRLSDTALNVAFMRQLRPSTCGTGNLRSVFLTGATGFIGSQVLFHLLQVKRQDTKLGTDGAKLTIFCLVRARDRAHGMYRIRDSLAGRGIEWNPDFDQQVIPVVGNLEEGENMGLGPKQMQYLEQTVDAVYHAADYVNFALPYDALRKANVLSLVPILKLCTTHVAKPLHLVSNFAHHLQYFAGFSEDLNVAVDETVSPPLTPGFVDRLEQQMPAGIMGYPWTKWAAEEIIGLDELFRRIDENKENSPVHPLRAAMRFWRRYWYSSDTDRDSPFPIRVNNVDEDLPGVMATFPSLADTWLRMATYCMKNYHLVRHPFTLAIPFEILKKAVAGIDQRLVELLSLPLHTQQLLNEVCSTEDGTDMSALMAMIDHATLRKYDDCVTSEVPDPRARA